MASPQQHRRNQRDMAGSKMRALSVIKLAAARHRAFQSHLSISPDAPPAVLLLLSLPPASRTPQPRLI